MKWTFTLLAAIWSANALANAIRWGGAAFTNGQVYDEFITHETADGAELEWMSYSGNGMEPPYYYLQGFFSVASANGKTTIRGAGHVLAYSTVFVQMDVGETVSLLTTFYASEALLAFGYRPGEEKISENHRNCSDYGIEVSSYGTQTIYLGFGTEAWCYNSDGSLKNLPWLYGWLEVAVNGKELTVVNSAIGLDGQSMTVGLIPEPTAAALLLLGLAPLALCRRGNWNTVA